MRKTVKTLLNKIIIFFMAMSGMLVALFAMSANETFRYSMAEYLECEDYLTKNNGPDEISGWIIKVSENNDYTRLILGDSVCCQMFSGLQWCNNELCIAGSNGAVTMAGQYILLREFIENHSNVSDVWLVVLPISLQRYVDKTVGYQYVVMPFVLNDKIAFLDDNTIETIEKSFGKYSMEPKFVEFLDKSAISRKIYLNYISNHFNDPNESWPIADISSQYIIKMKKLCDDNGITMHLLPAPSPDDEHTTEFINAFKLSYMNSELYYYFPTYIDNISTFPEEQFGDGTHFTEDYANQEHYNDIIKEMYSDDSLINFIRFE